MPTASIISIGDELLIGQTINTNAAWLGEHLNAISIAVDEVLTVSDTETAITKSVERAMENSSIILITGGLGPTKDDITKKTLAKYFNTELVLNDHILSLLEAYFKMRKRPMLEVHREMALLPANSELVMNSKGTAAGMLWNMDGKITVSMPGVPYEMKAMMTETVFDRLKKEYNLPTIIHKTIICAGTGESIIAEKIKDIEAALPKHIKLAYLPNLGYVKLRLTGKGENELTLLTEIDKIAENIIKEIPKYHIGYQKENLPMILQTHFIKNNLSLSLAESCTGGGIANAIVQIPGSSAYFKGGIVAYDYAIKENQLNVKKSTLENYGAVSEQTVNEMALNINQIMKTDYSIAVSGIAGPTGATPDKPVGTVWIAVAHNNNVQAKKYRFPLDRERNIKLTINYALYNLWRIVHGYQL